ncbi:hypothetical protein RUM43_008086 [Polyplax serrata]|uniref:ZP domain-containing protein n=1 Tax=Polyplax serrata TaxID=468196 RepID=A0AAN8SAA9_POLSC
MSRDLKTGKKRKEKEKKDDGKYYNKDKHTENLECTHQCRGENQIYKCYINRSAMCWVWCRNKTGTNLWRTEEHSVPIAVRLHRTLELAEDKFYVITCGKAGFKNARNETSLVSLKLIDKNRKVRVNEVFYGHEYLLRADISRPDGSYGIRVKSCFAFNKRNNSVPLIDEKGCPVDSKVMTPFRWDPSTNAADATLFSMFRFPDSTQMNFQCDIAICKGGCPEPDCGDDIETLNSVQGRALDRDPFSEVTEEGTLMASTSVFVLEPGASPYVEGICENTGYPPWLLYLCIAFGLMFLIMLLINIFLCSAMTCACARTEIIEKEPSIIEDYDPYRSWHGSQYGSRYSLNGKPNMGYTSGGSTMNSTRSISTNSDHYAIVHSRPDSRYSPSQHTQQRDRHRGPSSNFGSHYSGK